MRPLSLVTTLCLLSVFEGAFAQAIVHASAKTDAQGKAKTTSIESASAVTWSALTPAKVPGPRSYVAMAYDAASTKIVLFGGYNGTAYLNETWLFDGNTWSRVRTPVAPPARANAQMIYDVAT